MEGELLLPLYLYRFIRLDFVTINLVVILDYTIIILGGILMEFLEIAKSRYSVRDYKSRKVEPEKLEKILLAAHVAPTAANLQPVRLIVVQEDEGLNKVGKAANLYGAPLAIIVCSEHTKAWTRPFDNKKTVDVDASILTDHMMMEATELGLGSVWICYFKPDVIKQEFRLPDTLEPINILAIGYADGIPADPERHATQRILLDELVHYEKLNLIEH